MLGTSQETVRRWIRDGKLNAVQESRKSGNNVTEADLNDFLKKTPKYSAVAATGASLSALSLGPIGLPVVAAGLVAAVIAGTLSKQQLETARIRPEDLEKYLTGSIDQHKASLQKKKEAMEQLQEEIESEEQQIEALTELLRQAKKAEEKGKEDGRADHAEQ